MQITRNTALVDGAEATARALEDVLRIADLMETRATLEAEYADAVDYYTTLDTLQGAIAGFMASEVWEQISLTLQETATSVLRSLRRAQTGAGRYLTGKQAEIDAINAEIETLRG